MKQRVITGAVLAVILIPVFVIGGMVLNIVLLIASMAATYELYKMYSNGNKLDYVILGIQILLSGLLYFLLQGYYLDEIVLEWVFFTIMFVVVIGALMLVFVDKWTANDYGNMFVSVLYPSLGFGAIFAFRTLSLHNLGFLFLITIMTDVFAYAVGVKFGKHRLAPKISPKKSIEGSIGGTVFAVVLTMIYVYVFKMDSIGSIELSFFVTLSIILVLSIVGQIGDLVASKLKRHFGIKDYSNIFPGHGGVMDRFDSVLFAAMVLMIISKAVEIL